MTTLRNVHPKYESLKNKWADKFILKPQKFITKIFVQVNYKGYDSNSE